MIRRAWRAAARAAATAAGSVVLARMGLPVVVALLVVVVIAAAVWCWTVASKERAGNAAQVIEAVRGQNPPTAPAAPQPPMVLTKPQEPQRWSHTPEGASGG